MKRLLLALFLSLSVSFANAQGITRLCITTTGSNCVPITASNPLPITGASGGGDVNITEILGNPVSNTNPLFVAPSTTATWAATQSGTWTVQPGNTANTTPWLVTGSGTAGTAAAGVLTVQGIASMTPLLSNPGTAANWAVGATGAAPVANVIYQGGLASGATGGLLAGLKTCDLHAKYDASTSGSTTLVTGVSGRKVYICGYILATGGTATNLKLREGSDANCASNAADLTPAWQLAANDRVGALSPFWTGLVVSTNAYYVCFNASAANAAQGEIWFTIQ